MSQGVSRRDLLKRAGLAGAALTLSAVPAAPADAGQARPAASALAAPKREPIENLTQSEADMLEAICARIIPTDQNGPGARDARAAHFIDRALGGALKDSREAYRAGFAAFDRYCRSSRGAPFVELSERNQDSVLIDVETGAATGFTGSSAVFFNMVRTHTARHLRRSVLRRQRQLRWLGSDWLPGPSAQRLTGRSTPRRTPDTNPSVRIRRCDVQQGRGQQ